MMNIHLNGAPQTLDTESTITDLLKNHGYEGKIVAVAVNQNFVPKSHYDEHKITEGDSIEIVAPMQGG